MESMIHAAIINEYSTMKSFWVCILY